jgi:hypothetical protein
MKVLFVCGSLEEGRDGIGDYTRKFAQECAIQGLSAILVAVNDVYMEQLSITNNNGIPCYRIPQKLSWSKKWDEMLDILKVNMDLDWISIQFQPYAFSKKGIVKAAVPFFNNLSKKHKIHVMIHELWVAEEREASLKLKAFGFVQKLNTIAFLKKIKPAVVQTSIPLYSKMLNLTGVKNTILPLFSNIAYCGNSCEMDNIDTAHLRISKDKYLIGCLFGSIYHESWDLSSLFTTLMREKDRTGKEIMIVSIGKISYGQAFWQGLPSAYPAINFLTLGPQNEKTLSWWLSNFAEFGIVTTPAIIAGKSGSFMAFIEHGIPVLCKENDLSFNFEVTDNLFDDRVIQIRDEATFEMPKRTSPISLLKHTVQSFINTLNNTL